MRTPLKDGLDGLVNPILVRQMYQSLHGLRFVGPVWLMLLAAVVTCAAAYATTRGARPPGEALFSVLTVELFFAAGLVVPVLTFMRVHEEVRHRTLELVQITGLSAGRHVRGVLLAGLLNLALVIAVLAPFFAAAYLFQGTDAADIAGVFLSAALVGPVLCAVAVFFGALGNCRSLRVLAIVGFILFLLMGFQACVPAATFFGITDFLFSVPGVMALVTSVGGVVLWCWFLLCWAENFLTFPADRSWGRAKLALVVLAGFLVGTLSLGGASDPEGVYLAVNSVLIPVVAACGFLWAAEPDRVARRTERTLRRRGGLWRLVVYPFTDGPAPTGLYLTAVLGGLAALSALLPRGAPVPFMPGTVRTAPCALYALGYVLTLVGVCRGLVGVLPRPVRGPAAVRLAGMLLLAVLLIHSLGVGKFSPLALQMGRFAPASAVALVMPFRVYYTLAETSRNMGDVLMFVALPLGGGLGYLAFSLLRHLPRYWRAYGRREAQ